MRKFIVLILILNFTFLFSGEEVFENGRIEYSSFDDNIYYNGTIKYDDYEIPFAKMVLEKRADDKIYSFGVNQHTKGIVGDAYLAPLSTGQIHIIGKRISHITLDYAKFVDKDNNGAPFICSLKLINGEVENIENGYFELGSFKKYYVPEDELFDLKENLGDDYYYNKNIENEFVFDPNLFNLKPKIKYEGDLNISPTKVEGFGRVELSIFKEPISITGVNLPKFLSEGSPYYIEGEVSYDHVYDLLKIRYTKGMKSGNIDLSGDQELLIMANAENFGVKLHYDYNVEYELKDIVELLRDKNILMSKLNQHLPDNTSIDEELFVWSLQFFKSKEELLEIYEDDEKLDLELKLIAIVGFDPEEIMEVGDRKYADWNLLKLDIEFDGDSKTLLKKKEGDK